MVTNSLQLFARAPSMPRTEVGPPVGLVGRVLQLLGQLLCAVRGHDSVLHFEGTRVFLLCTSCGYASPGWDVGHRRPRLRFRGDPHRHVLRRSTRALVLRKAESRALVKKTA